MWDRFYAGLKYDLCLEVMKNTITTFEKAAKVALRVDSALWGVNSQASLTEAGSASQGPTPI